MVCICIGEFSIDAVESFISLKNGSFEKKAIFFIDLLAEAIVYSIKFWLLYYFIYKKRYKLILILSSFLIGIFIWFKGPAVILISKVILCTHYVAPITFVEFLLSIAYMFGLILLFVISIWLSFCRFFLKNH